jgi:hypothetical protein
MVSAMIRNHDLSQKFALLLLCAVAASCLQAPPVREEVDAVTSTPQSGQHVSYQLMFDSDPIERDSLLRVVEQAAHATGMVDLRLGGEVYRFIPSGESPFYLVIGVKHGGSGVVLLQLHSQQGELSVSEPLEMALSSTDPDSFSMAVYDDLNADGRPEAAFCIWLRTNTSDRPTLIIQTYEHGKWFFVSELVWIPEC